MSGVDLGTVAAIIGIIAGIFSIAQGVVWVLNEYGEVLQAIWRAMVFFFFFLFCAFISFAVCLFISILGIYFVAPLAGSSYNEVTAQINTNQTINFIYNAGLVIFGVIGGYIGGKRMFNSHFDD